MFAENFQILHSLGSGAMGEVFAAIDHRSNQHVAIKVIRDDKELSEHVLKRFRRESKLLSQLNHPNIIRIHEEGSYQGQPYFVMNLVEGVTFKTILQDKTFPLRRKIVLLKQVAEAIHYAHEHGITHRDLKPQNIMVTSDDHALVMDFGIAHNQATNNTTKITKTGMIVGTPMYMSPEQVNGEEITHSSDIFALGAIIYETITGKTPFSGNLSKIMWQIVNTSPQHPRKIAPQTPKDLAKICLKAMEKNKEIRYSTTLLIAQDLDRYLCGEKISVRTSVNLSRWLQQNAYTVLLPIAILGISIFFLLPAKQEKLENEHNRNEKTENMPRENFESRPRRQGTRQSPPIYGDPRFDSIHQEISVKEHFDICQQCYDLTRENNIDVGNPPRWAIVPTEILQKIIQHAQQH